MTQRSIAFFVPTLGGGGAERVVVNLAKAFAAGGRPVDLVVVSTEGPYRSQVPQGVNLVDLRAARVVTAFPRLAAYLRNNRPEALVSALPHANIAAILANRLAGRATRIVVSEHAPLSYISRFGSRRAALLPALMRWLYPSAYAAVVVSTGIAEQLANLTGMPRGRIKVVFNPVVSDEMRSMSMSAAEHPWFEDSPVPIVLSAGRLSPEKDFPTLLSAFRSVRDRRNVRLVILGEGECRRRLEELVRKHRLEADVAMPGFVSNPYAFMRRAAVFALSSTIEGLGNVLVEAMACGTPVVSTDCPFGPREILLDGLYGRLVPVGDAEGLARAIELTLDEHEKPDVEERAREFGVEASVRGYAAAMGLEEFRN